MYGTLGVHGKRIYALQEEAFLCRIKQSSYILATGHKLVNIAPFFPLEKVVNLFPKVNVFIKTSTINIF